ncbi:DegT/DnrJ/EryC1/StrS family aminotransferase [Micromonospora sp. NBC_01412]|uniref:DegT/DnrJ/EryC1/StrS family aminotransferase n=1 Tax=Micromonospora sp. NBC_01412 TaxID=2903590 RepID=UPI003248A9C9
MTADPVYLSPPDLGPVEEAYLLAAFRARQVGPFGPDITALEHATAERVGTRAALATSSGTAALHLAMLGLGVGPGQVVVVPTLTFAATANAVAYTGARPVFVDCDEETGNLDVPLLAALLARLRAAGTPVGAVMSVDLFGTCADYTSLLPVCAAAGVPVIEDAAESLGATHRGRPAGSFGRAAVLSFQHNKIMTTSSGGMLLSDDEAFVARCRYLAAQARQPVVHYEHTEVGYNYRPSNLLAAVGRGQLHRLDGMLVRRRLLRERYAKLFATVPGVRLLGDDDGGGNCWMSTVVVDPARAGWQAADLAAALALDEIETRPVFKPMHLQPVYADAPASVTGVAERLFDTGLILPSGSALDERQIDRVCGAIEQFLDHR